MALSNDTKIQIRIERIYGNKKASKEKFVNTFNKLDEYLKKRIIVENDDGSYP
jgi:UV DNA damage repair endonuclease